MPHHLKSQSLLFTPKRACCQALRNGKGEERERGFLLCPRRGLAIREAPIEPVLETAMDLRVLQEGAEQGIVKVSDEHPDKVR